MKKNQVQTIVNIDNLTKKGEDGLKENKGTRGKGTSGVDRRGEGMIQIDSALDRGGPEKKEPITTDRSVNGNAPIEFGPNWMPGEKRLRFRGRERWSSPQPATASKSFRRKISYI